MAARKQRSWAIGVFRAVSRGQPYSWQIGEKALDAVVPSANPNAAFDFEEGAAGKMGEVRTPTTCGMEAIFTL